MAGSCAPLAVGRESVFRLHVGALRIALCAATGVALVGELKGPNLAASWEMFQGSLATTDG